MKRHTQPLPYRRLISPAAIFALAATILIATGVRFEVEGL
jgi:hypothetical protein